MTAGWYDTSDAHVVVSWLEKKGGGGLYDHRVERVLSLETAENIRDTLVPKGWKVRIWKADEYFAERARLRGEEAGRAE